MSATATLPQSARALPSLNMTEQPLVRVNHFHLNLNVADVDRAVAFYRVLFGKAPFKHYPDFAEFVVDDPALVLNLTRYPSVPGGPINHIGLRFIELDSVDAVRERLEQAGFAPNNQGTVNCCYAKGTKVWAVDPDHNLLELYILQADLPSFGYEEPPALPEQTTGVTWEHRLPIDLPERISQADGSVDEVQLVGSLNGGFPTERLNALLAEAQRVLRPGGKVYIQGMVGDIPFPGTPDLPGLAARIRTVPVEHEPVDMLQAAGFVNVHYEQLGDIKCLKAEGVQLRKFRLFGTKSVAVPAAAGYAVSYRGPFEEIETDDGHVFQRGQTVAVTPSVWEVLRRGPAQKQFVFYTPADQSCCGGPN